MSFTPGRWLYPAVVVAALVAGCKKNDAPIPEAAPAAAHVGPPLTDDDARAFGEELAAAITTGDQAAADRLFRLADIVDRSVSNLDLSAAEKRGVVRGATAQVGQLSQRLIDEVKEGGPYKFLRAHRVDGRPRALVRSVGPAGGVNYHDFTLVRYPDGKVGAEDMYIYLSGEMISQTFRRVVLPILAEQKRGIAARLSGAERVFTTHAMTLVEINKDIAAGRHREAMEKYRALPREVQTNKVYQLVAVQAAQGASDDEYLAVLEQFREHYPDDPTTELVMVDYYVLKKKTAEAVRAIDRLDKAVGGDPHLWGLKAAVLTEAGRYPEARELAGQAIDREPGLVIGYRVRVAVALKEKNHADTLAWLKKGVLAKAIEADPAVIREDADYAAFVKSAEFAAFEEWVAERED